MIEQHFTPPHLLRPPLSDDDELPPPDATCPTCGRNDKTAKASAISRSGRGRFVIEDGTAAYFETELASLLTQPTQPQSLPFSGVVHTWISGWIMLTLIWLAVAGIRAQDFVSIPEVSLDVASWLSVAWFGVLMPILALNNYLFARNEAEQAMPGWQYATERWHELRYCSRDDVVFIPGEPRAVAPEHRDLLLREETPAVTERVAIAFERVTE